jgi:hypothetical protein
MHSEIFTYLASSGTMTKKNLHVTSQPIVISWFILLLMSQEFNKANIVLVKLTPVQLKPILPL